MLELFDRATRRRVAVLQNAFDAEEQEEMNAISTLRFSLPSNDEKNKYCTPFAYVRMDGGQLYRILPSSGTSGETGRRDYTAEHVISTLLDTVLFGFHAIGGRGYYTKQCIQYILDRQGEKHWRLGRCDFSRQFEYGFEQENLLGALFSLPKPFTEPYIWQFDTSNYPWTVNLVKLDTAALPSLYVRGAHNLKALTVESDPAQICTRLYPLGYGEGVNQLNIASVNGGVNYLQSPPEIVAKYGIVERVWVDRRYENPESLKAAAQAMLAELQEPIESYSVDFASLTGDYGGARLGMRVRIIDPELEVDKTTLVTGVTRRFDNVPQSRLTIANRDKNIAASVADLADRQRIEMTYSQGATQIYSQSIQENADRQSGLVMDFTIPAQMRIVNKVLCKVRLEGFRTYSKVTSATGTTSQTSASGGGSTQTSTSGGGSSETTTADGDASITSASGGGTSSTTNNSQEVTQFTGNENENYGHHNHRYDLINHTHSFSTPSHSHSVQVPSHRHEVDIPDHEHQVKIPSHSHGFTIPGHDHQITPGIFRFGAPTGFTLYINGKRAAQYSSTSQEIDLTPLLVEPATGKIPRGGWQSLEVRPNDLAYISIALSVQGFVQSRGDATV